MVGDAFVTCCIMLGYYVLCFITCEIAILLYLDGRKYATVKRERKFVNALVKDYEEASKSAELINQEARKFLDADLIKDGIIQVLTERVSCWCSKASKVDNESLKPYIHSFEDLTKRRESLKWYAWVLVNPVSIVRAAFQIKWLQEKISADFGKEGINTSLKRSRSAIRRLQGRFDVDEIELVKSPGLVGLPADELLSSLENLMIDNPDLMHGMEVQTISFRMSLFLLIAFMKELQCQLKVLSSRTESCWVEEAIETIEEANDVIGNTTRAGRKSRAIGRWSPVSYLNNWKARRKLRMDMEYVCFRITHLLKTMQRYDIVFLRVDPSKPSDKQEFDRPRVVDDTNLSNHREVVFPIMDRLDQLRKTSNELKDAVSSLRYRLYDIIKNFEQRGGTEDRVLVNLRNGYLKELRSVCAEDLQDSQRRPSKLLSEIIMAIKDAVPLVHICSKIEVTPSNESHSAIGLEEDVDKLVSALLITNAEHPSTICIWGMKGIGKTTLAKKVYHHKTVGDHFKVKRWISMPQVSSENLLSGNAEKQLLLEHLEKPCNSGMGEFLKEKNCLLIFDNVLSIEAWKVIKPASSDISEGSKIVLITSNKALAFHAGVGSNYPLRLRTREENWKLFTQMVKNWNYLTQTAEMSPYFKEAITIANKIVDSSGGLPLGIIGVGCQLWGKDITEETLSGVLKRMNQGLNGIPWSENLKANMVELQDDQVLWKCLSYCQLFPKDFEIPTRRILASFVVQFPNPPYQSLVKLIERNLLQVVQTKPDGNLKTCRLPSPILDLLLQGQVNSSKIQPAGSSLSCTFGKNGLIRDKSANIRPNERHNNLITIIDGREGNKPQQEIGEYLRSSIASSSFQQLQFLDLEGVFQPQLPKTIGKLKQLVYLGLRRTYLETVPSSIGDLVNLHTLDLKHTYIQSLPSLIWKLEKLQYLYLNHNCEMPQSTAISMENLQRLTGALVNAANLKVWLERLIKLQKLELALQLEDPEKEALDTWIAKLTQLQVLKLRSIDETKGPRVLNLERLSYLTKLSSLYLFGRLGKPDVMFPDSLVQLTLSASEIVNNPMPILEKLPNLKSLSLFSNSYKGEELACSQNGFPQLLVLKLWNLPFLKTLRVAGAMQKLRKLDIRSCNIFQVPFELINLTTESAAQPAEFEF